LYHFESILYLSLIWTTKWRVRSNCLELDESGKGKRSTNATIANIGRCVRRIWHVLMP